MPERLERGQQGDVLRDVKHIERMALASGEVEVSVVTYPFAVVITQDCELAQDWKYRRREPKHNDKLLDSVLVLPLFNVAHVFEGDYLNTLDLYAERVASDKRKRIKQNGEARFHYLEFAKDSGLPELVADFKRYFSVSMDEILAGKSERWVCTIGELYRELLSQRFSAFLARIALPDPDEPTATQ